MTAIGHNNPPPDRAFKRRWAAAIFDSADDKKPVGAVAMAFRLYHDMDTAGRGVALADLEIAKACGVSDRSVRTFKGWLVKAGFVKVLARGGRGGQTEYQACIPDDIQPADISGQPEIQPATISGKKQLNRKSIPAIENELPAKISGQIIQPADFAGQIASSRAVVLNNNINNNNNLDINTPSLSEQETAREPDAEPLIQHLENGLIVNCESITHPQFSISLTGIHQQLLGLVPMKQVKEIALGHARQWALDAAAGRTNAFPTGVGAAANVIRASIKAQQARDARVEPRAKATVHDKPKENEIDKINRMVSAASERQSTNRRLL